MVQAAESSDPKGADLDVIVVGAGFAGLYALHELRRRDLKVRVFERGSDVGGTWFWNRYPGARCDVESLQYSYSFDADLEQEWKWTERYAAQPEILRYLNHVADRFDLRRDISLGTSVLSATYADDRQLWAVATDRGEAVTARFCIMATGNLSAARIPEIEGRDLFMGPVYHTGNWPPEGVDFTGKRVAVIGTGSSGVQAIPMIARQASHLTVYQRTPNYSIPAHNRPLSEGEEREWKREYPENRDRARASRTGLLVPAGTGKPIEEASPEEIRQEFEKHWQNGGPGLLSSFTNLMTDRAANEVVAEFVRDKIRQTVNDPETARKLIPTDYPIGSKRICIDTDYFATFNRPNVDLVDLRDTPIEAITPGGIRTAAGEVEVDTIVFATGFDAMTGALLRIDIRGRNGVALQEKWREGPRTYLGLMTSGFPNFFTITGPGSPSVIGNVVLSIEFAVDWVVGCIAAMDAHGNAVIDADLDAENAWVDHVREVAEKTLYSVGNSWYLGANVPGKPRVFMPYVGGNVPYRTKVAEVIEKGYEGFVFEGRREDDAGRQDHAAQKEAI